MEGAVRKARWGCRGRREGRRSPGGGRGERERGKEGREGRERGGEEGGMLPQALFEVLSA